MKKKKYPKYAMRRAYERHYVLNYRQRKQVIRAYAAIQKFEETSRREISKAHERTLKAHTKLMNILAPLYNAGFLIQSKQMRKAMREQQKELAQQGEGT